MKKTIFALLAILMCFNIVAEAQNTNRLDQKTYRSAESMLRQVIDDTTQALRISHVKDSQTAFSPLTARSNRSIEQILLSIIDASTNSIRINDLDNNFVDLTGVVDGSMLVVEDGELVAKTEAEIKNLLYAYIKESANKIELGGNEDFSNGTQIIVDDDNYITKIKSQKVSLGDVDGGQNYTSINIDDSDNSIAISSRLLSLGDSDGLYSRTNIKINDNTRNIGLFSPRRWLYMDVSGVRMGDTEGEENSTTISINDASNSILINGLPIINEKTSTPTLTGNDQLALYMKADKLICAYKDGATTKYRFLNLTSTDATWTYTTTAP